MNVTDKSRQQAVLLHYASEVMNEIFDTLPNTTAGERDDPFEKAMQALTNYFTPKQNHEYEIYVSVKPSKKTIKVFQLFTQG